MLAPCLQNYRITKCNVAKPPENGASSSQVPTTPFFGINIPSISLTSCRPVLPIQIFGQEGLAYADTDATRSIAGQRLFSMVKDKVTYETLSISLADGTQFVQEVPCFSIEVALKDKLIQASFIALPNATFTLLGTDFVTYSKVVLDLSKQMWSFSDYSEVYYQYSSESTTRFFQADMMSSRSRGRQNYPRPRKNE